MNEVQRYVTTLIRETTQAKSAAEAILDMANAEGREMTDDEKKQFEAHMSDGRRWKAKLDAEKVNMAFRRSIEELAPAGPISDQIESTDRTPVNPADSLGEMFVKSGVFQALRAAKTDGRLPEKFRTQAVTVPYGFGRKAASSPLLESNTAGIFSTFGTDVPGVMTPGLRQLRPTIADLIPVIQMTQGSTARWRVATARHTLGLSDVPVLEAGLKPTVSYDFDFQSAELIKIAALTKLSEEYLEDDSVVVDFINADMPFQIRFVEEDYLADALYDGTSDAVSLSTGTTAWDEILAAMVEIQDAGLTPDAMLITPTNYAELLASKFTGGSEGYIGGGPFASTGNPWGGLRVIVTRAAVDEHPLVGAFGEGSRLFRKGAIRLDSTNSDEDDFQHNLVTIRAEMREIVAKTYPEGFVTADIGA